MRFLILTFLHLKYDWLWKSDKDAAYTKFASTNPSLDNYEAQLRYFGEVQKEVENVKSIHIIGALSLNTMHLKTHLVHECNQWKIKVRIYNRCERHSHETLCLISCTAYII